MYNTQKWNFHCFSASVYYPSLLKKGPWAEHLTSLPKRGVGALSTVSTFNHERAPMSCLQRLEDLEANKITYNGITSGF